MPGIFLVNAKCIHSLCCRLSSVTIINEILSVGLTHFFKCVHVETGQRKLNIYTKQYRQTRINMNSKTSQESPKISSFPFYCFPLFLCIDHLGRLCYLSLLFFRTLHSDGYIFPFLFPFPSLLFKAICKASSSNHFAVFCISLSRGWF